MDVETIDQEFGQLQQEAQLVGQTIEAFAAKLQTAADGGDTNAKGWILDLKGIALQIQQEQLQVQALLQALHDFTVNAAGPATPASGVPAPPPPAAVVSPTAPPASASFTGGGGLLGHFRQSNFGQAVASGAGMGVGFGLTESLISSIFQ